MLPLSSELSISAASCNAIVAEDVLYRQRLILLCTMPLPGAWLLFSLAFAQPDYRTHLNRLA